MSSPSSVGGPNGSVGIRDGTRYVLREITANLQNSPPGQSPRRKSGNEATPLKGEQQQQQQQHDVKVRFIREFADAGATVRETNVESSLSSASSFQSLTSTLSSKCSSGICVDSSPGKASDTSYLSADIPGLDDLISACENIRLGDATLNLSKDQSFSLQLEGEDLSGDQTFTSATDRISPNRTLDLSRGHSPLNLPEELANPANDTRKIDAETDGSPASVTHDSETLNGLEVTRYHQANSKLATSVNETFVQCTNDIAQETPCDAVNEAGTELKNVAKFEDSRDTSEKPVEINVHEVSDDTQKHVGEFETLAPIELGETLPVESLSDFETEEAKLSILDDTVAISAPSSFDESKKPVKLDENIEISAPQSFDEPERSTQLDETVDISEPQFFDFATKTPSTLESLSVITLDEAVRLETISSFKPSSLSDTEETSQYSTLPSLATLSNVCLTNDTSEIDIPIPEESKNKVENNYDATELKVVEEAASLSEKFAQIVAQIAENDLCTANALSAINEPTFLDAQKFIEDPIETKEFERIKKIEDIVVTREQNSIEQIAEIQSRELEIETADIAKETIDNISRIIEKEATKVEELSPTNPDIARDLQILTVAEEKPIVRDADSSTSAEDLNATVTIQDISAGNLFAVPESDQYAEFLPQQQSTALVLDRQSVDLNNTGPVTGTGLISGDNLVSRPITLPDDYAAFVPQKQSTALVTSPSESLNKLERQRTPFVTACSPLNESPKRGITNSLFNGEIKSNPKTPEPIDDRCTFEKLEIEANAVANDISNRSLEIEEENDIFVTATCNDLFTDPGGFDFLLSKTPRKNPNRNLRTESLYVKFDPLVSNTSMLPQGNVQTPSPPANEERNGEKNSTIDNLSTPKRNPALAAIDRLLFYSPMTNTAPTNTATIQKTNDTQEKVEPTEETSAETVNMAKELELVRSTVIQLEEQLEKLKIDNEEKQTSYQEKINQLQAQLAQEIKNKNQITVVVDEYEKSISRLVAERERDRKNLDLEKSKLQEELASAKNHLDLEKTKLQEELAAAKHHLDNTEAAFNDVHLKYERLKVVVATYKSNEAALKESLQENVEIIKALENRYEQVKSHATARLEKANQDLDAIRKQNESETVRLHAMLRKAELKSNSLAELVEQKTKENKELTQILDEVIARVGRNKSE